MMNINPLLFGKFDHKFQKQNNPIHQLIKHFSHKWSKDLQHPPESHTRLGNNTFPVCSIPE